MRKGPKALKVPGSDEVGELLVMRDDDELEVLLLPPCHHNGPQGLRQAGGIVCTQKRTAVGESRRRFTFQIEDVLVCTTSTCIQVGGGLIQRQDAAVEAEGLRQRQADDKAGQHLLPGGATPAHLQLGPTAVHDHSARGQGGVRGWGA